MNKINIFLFSISLFLLSCDKDATLPKDCLGIEGGIASVDECGVCDSDPNNDNVTCYDCTGEPNGPFDYDECGVCNNYLTYNLSEGQTKPTLPYGDCDCAGENYRLDSGEENPNYGSELDQCGICDNDSTNDCVMDCSGQWGGDAVLDSCGVCGGDGFSCCANITCEQPTPDCDGNGGCECSDNDFDCAGVCHGNGSLDTADGNCCPSGAIDTCGICEGDNTSCLAGCTDANACNYDASIGEEFDDGSCLYAELNYDCNGNCIAEIDCNNDCGGTAEIDCDGECRGGGTGLERFLICDCFEIEYDSFYCHVDPIECFTSPGVDTCCDNNTSGNTTACVEECLYTNTNGASYIFSNPYLDSNDCNFSDYGVGCTDDNSNEYYGQVYNDISLCYNYVLGCTDQQAINYNPDADIDDGSCNNYLILSWNDLDNGIVDVSYYSTSDIGGIQFDLTNAIFTSASAASGGEAASSGFQFSTSDQGVTALGFSFTGSNIPSVLYTSNSTPTLLTTINIEVIDDNLPICLENLIFSDSNQLSVTFESNCLQ